MSRSISILHLFGRMLRGGAEMRTLDVMRNIDRNQYQFHFCILTGLEGELEEEIRRLGGHLHYLPLGPSFARRYSRLCRCHSFDVVHSHVHYASGYMLRLASKAGVPRRITHFRSVQDDHGNSIGRRLRRMLMRRWVNRYSTDILAVSESSMNASWPQWKDDPRCRIVYNGLDPDAFYDERDRQGVCREFKLPDNAPLFIHIGRMDPSKNHLRLVRIFSSILKELPEAHFLLVGRSENAIEKAVRVETGRFRIEDRIHFLGSRSDVPRLLKAADVMLFPSLWEGLPGAVLEACAAGTPVMGSDIASIREVARYFTSIYCLSLREDDDTWAKAAASLYRELDNRWEGKGFAPSFAGGVFTVDLCARQLTDIWSGFTVRLPCCR